MFQIFEVKPENKSQLPIGTRVCVYWSRAYNCLFPGTIEDLEDVVLNKDNMVQVLLDDGDRRQVELGSVRMLPNNYSHVGKNILRTKLNLLNSITELVIELNIFAI